MLVGNTTAGTVYLSHGSDPSVPAIRFRPRGDRDSVQDLVEAQWSGSRNLKRFLSAGILAIEGVVDLPSAPTEYNALDKWGRARVRSIVLGTDEEFEANGLITPMGNMPSAPERVDTRYIKNKLLPVLEISSKWLRALYTDTKDKKYDTRRKKLDAHARELRKLVSTA